MNWHNIRVTLIAIAGIALLVTLATLNRKSSRFYLASRVTQLEERVEKLEAALDNQR